MPTMSADDHDSGQFGPWDKQPQDSRVVKYTAIAIVFFALALFRSRDRITPTLIVFSALVCIVAGCFAWAYEMFRGFKFDWLFSFVLYVMALAVAVGLLLLAIYIFNSM